MKLVISGKNEIHIIKQQEILYCTSDNSYTLIFLLNGEKIIVSKSLTKVLEQLGSNKFLRISQSYLINVEKVSRIDKKKKLVELFGEKRLKFTINVKTLISNLNN